MRNIIIFSFVILALGCNKDDDPTPLQAPVATDATEIENTSFQANWNNVSGANDYELDVAIDSDFASIVGSEKNLAGSTVVSNVNGNTEYFYRVRATLNGTNPSSNSNVISVTTLPDAPVATLATDVMNSSFTANWNAVAGITDYLLYVSVDNFPADPPNNLPNYDGVEVSGTSHAVTNLNSGTIYYFVVKSKIDNRLSEISNSIETITSN